jgi:putative Mg2+ transporter-C (MgtC) family protein
MELTLTEGAVRLLVAALLGGVIGLERDIHGRPAGLRTHLLVSMGSALFMILSVTIAGDDADPGRIAAQIVTGIGFLGAGAIIKSGVNVKGLTTAACLWVCASIGMCSGAGIFTLAVAATIMAIISLVALNYFERCYKCDSYRTLTIDADINVSPSTVINIVRNRHDVHVIFFDQEKKYDINIATFILSLRIFSKGITDKLSHQIIEDLEKEGLDLKRISWKH